MNYPIDNKKVSNSQPINCTLLDNVQDKLSLLIQKRLSELNLSRAALAKLMGVSRSYVTNMANATAPTKSGQYDPSPETVEKLAKHLEVSQSEILNALGYETKLGDENDNMDIVYNGLFLGYEKLSDEHKRIARKQIRAVIDSFKDEDFED